MHLTRAEMAHTTHNQATPASILARDMHSYNNCNAQSARWRDRRRKIGGLIIAPRICIHIHALMHIAVSARTRGWLMCIIIGIRVSHDPDSASEREDNNAQKNARSGHNEQEIDRI